MPSRTHLRAQQKSESGQRGAEGYPLQLHTGSLGLSSNAGSPRAPTGISFRGNK
jgi:hypothetical protein